MDLEALNAAALQLRKDVVEMSHACGRAAHPGPAMSCADIVAALYFGFMNVDPREPNKEDRDRFILSKGHACPVQYAALAEKGFFSKAEFSKLRHPDGLLQGHPTYHKTPGVDMTAGSLGNGLGIGLGMAYYLKHRGLKSNVFVILGDGELNEGTIWEAVMYAPVAKAGNLVAYVDINGFQSCGACSDILPQGHLKERFESFGWRAVEIDGHDMAQIVSATEYALSDRERPCVVLASTVKGKGVSFMENNNSWHQHVVSDEQYEQAMAELEGLS